MQEREKVLEHCVIRPIEKKDNEALAHVVRSTLKEFGADLPGTVYFDPTTDHLYEVFSNEPRSVYHLAEMNDEVVGGAGVFPSPGLPEDTCELVKMYLLKKARGLGLGRVLIEKALASAIELGYKNVYLETLPQLKEALNMYKKFGFEYIDHPMGNTGHFGCDLWMFKKLKA